MRQCCIKGTSILWHQIVVNSYWPTENNPKHKGRAPLQEEILHTFFMDTMNEISTNSFILQSYIHQVIHDLSTQQEQLNSIRKVSLLPI